jgi:23S rRNA pseudouridine2605 synthase
MIKLDGSRVLENVKVKKSSKLEIVSRNDTNTLKLPIPEETKLWVFYKPREFTTTLQDKLKRPSIYQFLATKKFPRIEIWTIGHLDYYSEGIMLLTNSKDLAEATEFKTSLIRRKYEARVNGKVDSKLVESIRKGLTLTRKKFKPMHVWTRQGKLKSKNVWVGAVLNKSHPRELRCLFERKRMHVNRLIRTHYGPYKMFGLKPGEFKEVEIDLQFHKLLFSYYKSKSLKQ